MATVQCGGPPTRATHVTMPARLLRGDVLQCGAASAGARGRRGVCGEPAHLPLGPSRFSWPPTCCFCAFSPWFSGGLCSRSVTPAPNVATFGFNPRALKLRSCCAHPLSVRRMSGPSCCPSLVCVVLFCVGFCVPLWCSAPHPAPSNLRPCAALIKLLRLLQQIRFPSAHGIGSMLRRMTYCARV